jgi:hypothetical protein
MNQFISYEGLPINSGGAHKLNRNGAEENYKLTLNFLKKFTNKTTPEFIHLRLYQSEKKEYSTFKLVLMLTMKFGFPKFDSGGLLNCWTWKLTQREIVKGFEILELNKKLPENMEGPFVLSFEWNFNFKDPDTNFILPNQEKIPQLDFRIKNSRIYLRTSKNSSISVWFAFPFEQIDKYEIEYINKLKTELPFKMSEVHWRLWKKSRNGNWRPNKVEIKNVS